MSVPLTEHHLLTAVRYWACSHAVDLDMEPTVLSVANLVKQVSICTLCMPIYQAWLILQPQRYCENNPLFKLFERL